MQLVTTGTSTSSKFYKSSYFKHCSFSLKKKKSCPAVGDKHTSSFSGTNSILVLVINTIPVLVVIQEAEKGIYTPFPIPVTYLTVLYNFI